MQGIYKMIRCSKRITQNKQGTIVYYDFYTRKQRYLILQRILASIQSDWQFMIQKAG